MNSSDFNADDLLKDINKSILTKGIIVALVVHAILVFGTSFGLYKDWSHYGVKKPSTIKEIKKQEQVAADKARREEEIQRKAAEAAAAASNAVPVKATAETKAMAAKTEAKAGEAASKTVTPPEIKPMTPASTDDVSLDDLGI